MRQFTVHRNPMKEVGAEEAKCILDYSNEDGLVRIPDTVEVIKANAFEGVSKGDYKKLFIPKSVRRIERMAFYNSGFLDIIFEERDTFVELEENSFSFSNIKSVEFQKVKFGRGAFSYCRELNEVIFHDKIDGGISLECFHGCTRLSNVTFDTEATCESIGYRAFSGNKNLKKFNMPPDVSCLDEEAFSLSGLTEFYCSISIIPKSCFKLCENLEKVVISSDVVSAYAFDECTSLTEVEILSNSESGIDIGKYAFHNCSNLSTVKTPNAKIGKIGMETFGYCYSLTLIDLSFCKSFGAFAFRNCRSLENAICYSVEELGEGAFQYCSVLNDVRLSESLLKIEKSAFLGCGSLSEISLPKNIIVIEKAAFADCENLKEISIPDKVEKIGDEAFCRCSLLEKVIFSESNNLSHALREIGKKAFFTCLSLTEINMPTDLAEISEEAFSRCSRLNTIIFNENICCIGDAVFKNCVKLENILLPASIEKVGREAFYGCIGLTKVEFLKKYPPSLKDDVFTNCTNLKQISFGAEIQK